MYEDLHAFAVHIRYVIKYLNSCSFVMALRPTHIDLAQAVRLLWTSDQLAAETST
jgi:hypothetical protein